MKQKFEAYLRIKPIKQNNLAIQYELSQDKSTIDILSKQNKKSENTFNFKSIFPPSTQQDELFKTLAVPIIDTVLDGFNATIFAYGQTGSGKTFTISGSEQWA